MIISDLRFKSPQFPRPIALKLLRFLYYSKNKSFFFYHFEYFKANRKSLPCLVKKLANGGCGIRTEDIFWVRRSIRVFINNNNKKKFGGGKFHLFGIGTSNHPHALICEELKDPGIPPKVVP